MTSSDLIVVRDAVLGLTAGWFAGLIHFSSLWWNTRLLVTEHKGSALALLGRLVLTAGILAILAWLGVIALLGGTLGVLLARYQLLRRVGGLQ